MKKSILSVTMAALLGLGVVSCREQKSDAEETADDVEETMDDEKQEHFKNNQRMNMMMSLLKKMNKETLGHHISRSKEIIKNPSNF